MQVSSSLFFISDAPVTKKNPKTNATLTKYVEEV